MAVVARTCRPMKEAPATVSAKLARQASRMARLERQSSDFAASHHRIPSPLYLNSARHVRPAHRHCHRPASSPSRPHPPHLHHLFRAP